MRRVLAAALCALISTVAAIGLPSPARADTVVSIVNNDANGNQATRFDVDGNGIDAHDGSIIQAGGLFYMYGTSYGCGYLYGAGGNANFCGFKVYSSPDLANWTDRGYAVTPSQCSFCFRPHTVFNASTGQYVLWADNGGGIYGVYTAPSPTGPFTRQANPTLHVAGNVDLALFVDDDGTGYVLHTNAVPRPEAPGKVYVHLAIEKLNASYTNTVAENRTVDLGNVEAFTAFKRNGRIHIMMSDPSCAYCAGETGVISTTNLLTGAWEGIWYDGAAQNIYFGYPEPRNRGRLVNPDNCGGQPIAVVPVTRTGGTDYLFVSDRWAPGRDPNQSLANLYIGPLTFDAGGLVQTFSCVNSFNQAFPGSPAGAPTVAPDQDQSSGVAAFRHYCDIGGTTWRQQTFTAGRTGSLTGVNLTAFQRGAPNKPLVIDVIDAGGQLLNSTTVPTAAVQWGPRVIRTKPNAAVVAGQTYRIVVHSATTTGCYGFEYNDAGPYAGGQESYSTNNGTGWTAEAFRDVKFTTDVSAAPVLVPEDLPAGWTRCAGEGGTCTVGGTRVVAYGAGDYRFFTATGSVACTVLGTGGDPAFGVVKSCYVAPAGGPSGATQCATDGGTCTFTGTKVLAYGANGAFAYRVATGTSACTAVTFGRDPIAGAKACYVLPSGAPTGGWTLCAADGATCNVAGQQPVAYGANGAFYTRLVSTSTACSAAAFGGDPLSGTTKACYVRTGAPVGYGTQCAGEGGTCSFSGTRTVAYGAAGRFAYKSFTNGTTCNPAAFGRDPIFGVVKSCYVTP